MVESIFSIAAHLWRVLLWNPAQPLPDVQISKPLAVFLVRKLQKRTWWIWTSCDYTERALPQMKHLLHVWRCSHRSAWTGPVAQALCCDCMPSGKRSELHSEATTTSYSHSNWKTYIKTGTQRARAEPQQKKALAEIKNKVMGAFLLNAVRGNNSPYQQGAVYIVQKGNSNKNCGYINLIQAATVYKFEYKLCWITLSIPVNHVMKLLTYWTAWIRWCKNKKSLVEIVCTLSAL